MKKVITLLLSLGLMLAFAACSPQEDPAPADHPEEQAQEQEEEQTPQSTIPAPEEAYGVLLGEYYTAAAEEWDFAKLMEKDYNYLLTYCYDDDGALQNIGYAFTDLDGDGTQELLIGALGGEEFVAKMIFELYTMDRDGVAQEVFGSTERDRYYYAGGALFANTGSGSAFDSFETTKQYAAGAMTDLQQVTAAEDYQQAELIPLAEWNK